jgi:prenyltransferase beta subunit
MTPADAHVIAAKGALAALLLACAALSVCAVCPALAAAPNQTNQARLDSTVRYLQDVQNPDGGFGGAPGAESSPDFSAWVAFALAAAGINPQDQARPAGTDAYTYLVEHSRELTGPNAECPTSSCTTELDRVLLVVDASGTDPHDFGGVDLTSAILARQLPEGSFPHYVGEKTAGINDTIFAILALGPIPGPDVREALQRAAIWLEDEQNPDGGWPTVCPKTAIETCAAAGPEPGEVDMTGAAIQALNTAGRTDTTAQQKAFEFLHEAQNPDGGFPEYPGRHEESNVASTAWAVQGMWAAGENPERWIKDPSEPTDEPLGYMASLQQADGSIHWKASSDSNPVWMTAYVAPAFAGQALPIPAVPRATQSKPTPPDQGSAVPATQGAAEPGQGGESSQSGGGVIAGGGGHGAPLFSRPQPQSQGRTPGGARQLDTTRARRDGKHRREPAPHHTPATTTRTAAATTPGQETNGPEVKGVLIAASAGGHDQAVLEPGAPGLHSAGAGVNQTPWPAIVIGGTALLLCLVGSQLERRRPQVIL